MEESTARRRALCMNRSPVLINLLSLLRRSTWTRWVAHAPYLHKFQVRLLIYDIFTTVFRWFKVFDAIFFFNQQLYNTYRTENRDKSVYKTLICSYCKYATDLQKIKVLRDPAYDVCRLPATAFVPQSRLQRLVTPADAADIFWGSGDSMFFFLEAVKTIVFCVWVVPLVSDIDYQNNPDIASYFFVNKWNEMILFDV